MMTSPSSQRTSLLINKSRSSLLLLLSSCFLLPVKISCLHHCMYLHDLLRLKPSHHSLTLHLWEPSSLQRSSSLQAQQHPTAHHMSDLCWDQQCTKTQWGQPLIQAPTMQHHQLKTEPRGLVQSQELLLCGFLLLIWLKDQSFMNDPC